VVGKDEQSDNGDSDGDATLNVEKPTSCSMTEFALHSIENTNGNQTTEGVRTEISAEDRIPDTELLASVPMINLSVVRRWLDTSARVGTIWRGGRALPEIMLFQRSGE
jgi:hypothetical protein